MTRRLAAASGDGVAPAVEAGMQQLLHFFEVEPCGILEIQPDVTQARLQHVVYEKGVAAVPTNVEYGALFPWTHARCVMQGEMFAQHSLDDLPPEGAIDRASAAALKLQTIVSLPVRRRRDGRRPRPAG